MTDDTWEDHGDSEPGIVRVSATPLAGRDGVHSEQELTLWQAFGAWLKRTFRTGEGLGTQYAEAKVAHQNHAAKKTIEEAGEIAAKRDLRRAQTGIAKQEELKLFIENLRDMDGLSPPQQALALAKMLDQDPSLLEQAEKVKYMMETLHLTKGVAITPLPSPSKAVPTSSRGEAAEGQAAEG